MPDNDWWTSHDNLVTLTGWMAAHGFSANEVAAAVEKPWKYDDEFRQAWDWEEH